MIDEEIIEMANVNYNHALGYQFTSSEILCFARLITAKQIERDAWIVERLDSSGSAWCAEAIREQK